jgi:hypothetical protein
MAETGQRQIYGGHQAASGGMVANYRGSIMILRKAMLAVLLALTVTPWSVSYAASYDVLELPAVPSEMAAKY